MNGFMEWLEKRNESGSKMRAVLRRSLSFDPGSFPPSFPYVEPFVRDSDSQWRREALYLVAGLWASHWREGRSGESMPIGEACWVHQAASGSTSTELRFVALLDADRQQLPYRLRQMVALLKEYNIDFESLLNGLIYWEDDLKRTQNAWARDFYRNSGDDKAGEGKPEKEKR
ncbi:MAG TPA: type I-E CRISPR-associated protein Cse2/CasB [Rectinemataceae bacterium]|nr:type I-E CRISPR-associated protein Cse2/CasB [Rectinemataceae bacterium]